MKRINLLRSWILKLLEMIRACCGADKKPLAGVPDDPQDSVSNPVSPKFIEALRVDLELEKGNVTDEVERDFRTLVKANERKPENRSSYYAIVQSLRFILNRARAQQDAAIKAEYELRGRKMPQGLKPEEYICDLKEDEVLRQELRKMEEQFFGQTGDHWYVETKVKRNLSHARLAEIKEDIKYALERRETDRLIELKRSQGGVRLADDPKLVAKLNDLTAEKKEEMKPVEASTIKPLPKPAFNYAAFQEKFAQEVGQVGGPVISFEAAKRQVEAMNPKDPPKKEGKKSNGKGKKGKDKPKHRAAGQPAA